MIMDTLIEPKYDYKHWEPTYLTFDSEWHQYSVPNEIGKSAINLVTETDHDRPFITEKTWNPILWGKSFIIMGNTQTNLSPRRNSPDSAARDLNRGSASSRRS